MPTIYLFYLQPGSWEIVTGGLFERITALSLHQLASCDQGLQARSHAAPSDQPQAVVECGFVTIQQPIFVFTFCICNLKMVLMTVQSGTHIKLSLRVSTLSSQLLRTLLKSASGCGRILHQQQNPATCAA